MTERPAAMPDPTPTIAVRPGVLADLEPLADVLDAYLRFDGRAADHDAARAFLRDRFDHGDSVAFIASNAGRAVASRSSIRVFRRWHWHGPSC